MNHPPVAIVGGGLGGLSAAIYLRLAGHPVRIFEANSRVGGRANRIEQNRFQFDTGPSLLNYPWVFEECFAAAGRKLSDYVSLTPVDPALVFRWRDGASLSLSSDLIRLLESCEQVEPKCAPGLFKFLHDAQLKYHLAFDKLVCRNADNPVAWIRPLTIREMTRLSVHHSLYRELRRFFKCRYILEALGAYGMYLGGSPFHLPGFFSILPFGEIAHGLWLPKGGVYRLVAGMERLARELGVEIRTNSPVQRIETRDGRVRGVALSDESFEEFSLVVSNVDAPTTDTELLRHEPLLGARRRRAQRLRMTPSVFTFYWGVRGRIEGLQHHTIFLPADYRRTFKELCKDGAVPSDLPFYISVASATDPSLVPPGDTTVFVLVPVPTLSQLGGVDWPALTQTLRARVLDRLRLHEVDLTPGRIVAEHCWTPLDWRKLFGLYDGSAFGAAHTLFQVGPFRTPNYAREISGLYYTGAGTTPGTGMPMVVLSGRLTAERIADRAR